MECIPRYSWQRSHECWRYVVFEALEHQLVDDVQCSGAAQEKRRSSPKTIHWSSRISRERSQCCFRCLLGLCAGSFCLLLSIFHVQFHSKQCTVHTRSKRQGHRAGIVFTFGISQLKPFLTLKSGLMKWQQGQRFLD